MNKCTILLMTLSMYMLFSGAYSQCSKLEPPDGKVMLIVGQDCNATGRTAYGSGYLDDTELSAVNPAGITTYYSLTASAGSGLSTLIDWGAGPLHAQQYIGNSYYTNSVISIGLFMTDGYGNTLNVNGGGYDGHLDALSNWIKSVAPRPVYLRIGYEFDGQYWNNPTAYKNAWVYIVDRFRSQGVDNCAYVWQSASGNGGTAYLLQWYPGDTYVDWLGYSHFEFGGNQNEGTDIFTLARQKRKPVMIAEATPKGLHLNNSSEATAAWNGYFTRLFNKINNNIDVVKALCYINQDWDAQALWSGYNWGNSRIQANGNGTIKTNWINEISKSYWLPASPSLWSLLQNNNSQIPYNGIAASIPGTIQAENFDEGCIGLSYYDNTGGNSGGSVTRYGYSVDMGPTADVSGGSDVGWTATGEWLEYTVSVSASATYNFTFRVATPNSGNTFHLEQDGVDVSGIISVPNTGSWTSYANLVVNNISLSAGTHVLKIYFDNAPAGFNINYFSAASTTLPVLFDEVNVLPTGEGQFQIIWSTQWEKDIREFQVERSVDGEPFEKAGVIEGRNQEKGGSYSFEDKISFTGIIYYRIKLINQDNSFSFSPAYSINSASSSSLSIYPNPCQEDLYIKSSSFIQKIRLLDLVGNEMVVFDSTGQNQLHHLSLMGIPDGIYFLEVYDSGGEFFSRRVVKGAQTPSR